MNSNQWSAVVFLLIVLLGTLFLSGVPFLVSHHNSMVYEGLTTHKLTTHKPTTKKPLDNK